MIMMQKSSKQDSLIMYISHQRKQLLYRSVTLLCLLCIVSFCLVLFVTSRFSRFLQFVQQHDKVILHCHHGKNRSAAAATAWVAVKEDIEWDQAAPCLQVLMLVFFDVFFLHLKVPFASFHSLMALCEERRIKLLREKDLKNNMKVDVSSFEWLACTVASTNESICF